MFMLAAQSLPQQSQILKDLADAKIYFPIALCVIGSLLMIFGFKAYKWIVLVNFISIGALLGPMLVKSESADKGGQDLVIVMSIAGAVLMGILAWPLLKYAVAACGGLVGFVIGMVVWAYCDQPLNLAWAGGLVGLAVLGMLSFVLFKTTVILFTSIEGAALFVFGTCALLMHYAPWQKQVATSLDTKPILLPLVVGTLAAIALFWQHQQHGLIGHDGAPGGGGGGAKPAGDKKK
ncbi:MAG TPA: hypothetical protein VHM90_14400 [Phycisphaerae bacterium]|jgi:hypothetical protein|nr:hypothetical protein [Phycisphaerae bacterium]